MGSKRRFINKEMRESHREEVEDWGASQIVAEIPQYQVLVFGLRFRKVMRERGGSGGVD